MTTKSPARMAFAEGLMSKPVVLAILDGWGDSPEGKDNAITNAHAPNWKLWVNQYPWTLLDASGGSVGLPEGQMGNSEVGHMTIGAGRAIFQDLPRINQAIDNGQLASRFDPFLKQIKQQEGDCHIMGLASTGGVHAHRNHVLALVPIVLNAGIPVHLHLWLDGRDTLQKSALHELKDFPYLSHVQSLMGRYYAMDRDHRWDRTEKAYRALVSREGALFSDPLEVIQASYDQGIFDEFMLPHVRQGYTGISARDGILIANFRSDRVRQISNAFVAPDFKAFPRAALFSPVIGMTRYAQDLKDFMAAAFEPQLPQETLGEVLSKHGKKQFRIAETEKYAHITFFFNGGREGEFPGETRCVVPSPSVATYDLKPEMAAFEITEILIKTLKEYDFVVVNYANADMVGHTGKMEASIKAVEALDVCLGKLAQEVLSQNGILLITADHGNVEQMKDPLTGEPHTAHTCNAVPFMVVSRDALTLRSHGTLADIAPTILDLMDLPPPSCMAGQSLRIR